MMVRSTARFSRLVLVAPLGIKLRGRDERDIADMHGIERTEYLRLAWAEPAKGEADYTALPDTELAAIVRGREAFALYGWKPYTHNPRLKRWQHRIDRPTLPCCGERKTASSPLRMATACGKKFPTPGSTSFPGASKARAISNSLPAVTRLTLFGASIGNATPFPPFYIRARSRLPETRSSSLLAASDHQILNSA
jgi:hypothetical protein